MPTTVSTMLPHHRQDEEETYQFALLVEMHADVDVLDHGEDALQVQCGLHILRRSLLLGEYEELRERHYDSGLQCQAERSTTGMVENGWRVEERESAGNESFSPGLKAGWEADGGLPNIRGRDMTPWVIAIQSRTTSGFCNKSLWSVDLREESLMSYYKTPRPIDRTETLQNR